MMRQLRHADARGLHARRDFLRPQSPDSIPNSFLGFCYQKKKSAQECWAEMFLALCHFLVPVGYYLKPRVCVRACWQPFPPRGRKACWFMRHSPKEPKYTVWHSNQGGNEGAPFTATRHQRWVNPGISRQNTGPCVLGRTHRHPVTCQLTQGALTISVFEFLWCLSVVKRHLLPRESCNE